jgi:hypothetical protein
MIGLGDSDAMAELAAPLIGFEEISHGSFVFLLCCHCNPGMARLDDRTGVSRGVCAIEVRDLGLIADLKSMKR